MKTSSACLRAIPFALLAFALIAGPRPASAGPGHVTFTFVQKMFDSDDWDPIDKQTDYGAEAAFGPGTWPVQIAAYLERASKEKDTYVDDGFGNPIQITIDGTTTEFGVGLNKTFGEKKIRPYLGAGGVYTKTDITLRQSGTSASDDANGFGFWGGAGAFYRVGSSFNLGGGVRYSQATVDYEEFQGQAISYPATDVAAGGFQIHALIGWSWPKLAP